MPVRFKKTSEYTEKFDWLQSKKSASFKPSPEQAAKIAGLNSAELGEALACTAMEPAIQRKKKPLAIGQTSTTKMFPEATFDDYVLLGTNQKFSDNIKYKAQRPTSPVRLSSSAHDEFMLLGGNQKFAKNIEYRDLSTRKLGKTYVAPRNESPARQPQPHQSGAPEKRTPPPPPKVIVDTGAPQPALELEEPGNTGRVERGRKNEEENRTPPRPMRGGPTVVLKKQNGDPRKGSPKDARKDARSTMQVYNRTTKQSIPVSAGGDPGKSPAPRGLVTYSKTRQSQQAKENRRGAGSDGGSARGRSKQTALSKAYTAALTGKRSGEKDKAAPRPAKDESDKASSTYAFKYKAGIAPPRPAKKRKSEYQLQYSWKRPTEGQSPMLDADNMIHNNNREMAPPPRSAGVPVEAGRSEYKRQFQSWAPFYKPVKAPKAAAAKDTPANGNVNNNNSGAPTNSGTKLKRAKSMSALSPDKLPPAGVPSSILMDPSRLRESMNPQKPFFPHGLPIRWRSEYDCNFQSPSKFQYARGAWLGAAPPHLLYDAEQEEPTVAAEDGQGQPIAGSVEPSWLSEVMELRKRAEEYRLRSLGTHFSRQHTGQLLAHQAELWDEASVSDTLSALSLEQPANGAANAPPRQSQQPRSVSTATSAEGGTSDPPSNQATVGGGTDIGQTRNNAAAVNRLTKPTHANRRLAWNEMGDGATPSVSDSIKSIPSATEPSECGPNGQEHEVTESGSTRSSSTLTGTGRVGTPELVGSPVVKRHHLDLTTPARGGAILIKSPKRGRSPERMNTSLSPPRQSNEDGKWTGTSLCNCNANERSEQLQRIVTKKAFVSQRPVSPVHGQPTIDTHPLLDEEASYDRVLETRYVCSPQPAAGTGGKPRRPKGYESKAKSGLGGIQEGAGMTYKIPPLRDEEITGGVDDLNETSSSICSMASSRLSLASDLLEKARNRRDEFWGPSAKTKQ